MFLRPIRDSLLHVLRVVIVDRRIAEKDKLLRKIQGARIKIEGLLAKQRDFSIQELMAFTAGSAKKLGIRSAFQVNTFQNLAARSLNLEIDKLLVGEVRNILNGMEISLQSRLTNFILADSEYDLASATFTEGVLKGLGTDQIARNLTAQALGTGAGTTAAASVAGRMTLLVRTNIAKYDTDSKLAYAEERPTIVGAEILRGPGVCTSNICGDALGGIAEGESSVFLLADGIPRPPFHPCCFCAVVGYVFSDEVDRIGNATRNEYLNRNNLVFQASKSGDWSQTGAAARAQRSERRARAAA